MHRIITDNREAIAELCRRFGVQKLEVFGSAARAKDFDETSSDADFLVQFRNVPSVDALTEYFGLRDALSELLDRPVDLIEAGAVRNPFVKAQIERQHEPVYVA